MTAKEAKEKALKRRTELVEKEYAKCKRDISKAVGEGILSIKVKPLWQETAEILKQEGYVIIINTGQDTIKWN